MFSDEVGGTTHKDVNRFKLLSILCAGCVLLMWGVFIVSP